VVGVSGTIKEREEIEAEETGEQDKEKNEKKEFQSRHVFNAGREV
jgi:hypothetical protein